MSIKVKFLAVVAAVMISGGLGATAPTASTATPSCGATCINLFPNCSSSFVLDVLNQGENVGEAIILAPASNSNPGEDFTYSLEGHVSDFIAANLMSPGLSAYNNDPAYQIEYSPLGV